MADVPISAKKLEQRHKNTAELSSYTNELIDMLDSGEAVVSEVQKLSDTTTKVADKISKAKKATASTKQLLDETVSQIQKNNSGMRQELQNHLKPIGTDIPSFKLKIDDIKQKVRQKERHCEDLKREHRRVKNSKVQRRLQRAIVNMNFDLLSTEQNIRGYIKSGSSGDDLQTFEIDFSKESPYMELVEVCRDSQTKAVVNLHGATLQSWINNGEEMIFVSKDAVFNNVKAIRGGIPVVFPCFGAWDMGPQHGFARTSKWTCSKPPFMDESGNAVATFTLVDTEDTRKMWNGNKFEVNYTVVVKTDCLVTKFTVCNQNSMESFDFTCLLHTYFLLPDVSKTTISGLGGLLYVDKTDGGKEKTEESDPKTISQFTDSVYKNASKDHLLTNVAGGRTINIKKMNFPDTVVWNPWAEKAKAMADFGDDQYRNMVCVEAGHVSHPVSLKAGETYTASQELKVL